jgi:hypothetical protein
MRQHLKPSHCYTHTFSHNLALQAHLRAQAANALCVSARSLLRRLQHANTNHMLSRVSVHRILQLRSGMNASTFTAARTDYMHLCHVTVWRRYFLTINSV